MTNKRFGCLVLVALFLLLARDAFLSSRDSAQRASCRPDVLLTSCNMYADTNGGMFPPLSSQYGRLTFNPDVAPVIPIYEYACPMERGIVNALYAETGKNAPIDDWSFVYLGYFLENEAQGEAFLKAYVAQAGKQGAFEGDLDVGTSKGNCGTGKLFRLRTLETLPPELSTIKDKAASIPVVIEWPENHRKGGQVVYLDHHTEYVKYPGKWPMTKDFIDALRAIDAGLQPNLSPRLTPEQRRQQRQLEQRMERNIPSPAPSSAADPTESAAPQSPETTAPSLPIPPTPASTKTKNQTSSP